MKIKKSDRWKGILVLLVLLFIVAKDQIMAFISPCESSGSTQDQTPNNTITLPTPDFNPYALGTKQFSIDAESYERGEDKDVTMLSQSIIKSAFDPTKDQLIVTKYGA